MADNTLTPKDKARVLASIDMRRTSDRDGELYQLLKQMPEPQPADLDGKTRRAITSFVIERWAGLALVAAKNNQDPASMTMGAMTEMLITGYELGRKLQKPLAAPANNPPREDN
ncbi:MAG: hypothetical protein PHQ43_01510 [Dehalococcoidales bacterium]|nr:hypothetical protein [Dehalococcoidales bacterium]